MTSTTDNARVQELLARSAVDNDFRTALLTDPRAALEQAAGKEIPENLSVKFIEKDADCDAMFVLPDPVRSDELTPEQLEAVAGGCAEGIEIGDINVCWFSF
jgi:hypothetical protein